MKYILAMLLAVGSVTAQEKVSSETISEKVTQDFGYLSVGLGPFPLPIPAFTGGYRLQSGSHGFDTSFQVQTVVYVTQLKANLLYHYYPKPCLASQSYFGVGFGPSVIFNNRTKASFAISPEFVFGKQYRNETNDLRFFQLQLGFPTFALETDVFPKHHHHSGRGVRGLTWFPLVIITYGIGF